jgi:hypothetical protein
MKLKKFTELLTKEGVSNYSFRYSNKKKIYELYIILGYLDFGVEGFSLKDLYNNFYERLTYYREFS